MTKHMGIFVLAVLIVVVLLASTVFYTVDETKDIVLVKTFGKVTGAPQFGASDAGLKRKLPWPIQNIVRYDSRVSVVEDPYAELSTHDKQNIMLSAFCAWRIGDPVKFYNNAVTFNQAQSNVTDRLKSYKAEVVGQFNMSDIVNVDPKEMKIGQIEERITDSMKKEMMDLYGIEVVRVGLKILGLQEQVSQAVIDAQIKERKQEAERYRSNGDAQALAIKSRAEADSGQILAFARRKAEDIRTEGARDAMTYYSSFSKNDKLAMFLRSLDSLRKELDGRAIIIMDRTQNPAIDMIRNGASLDVFQTPPTTQQPDVAATQPAK